MNGESRPSHLLNSMAELQRAPTALTRAAGFAVQGFSALVFVDAASLTVKAPPRVDCMSRRLWMYSAIGVMCGSRSRDSWSARNALSHLTGHQRSFVNGSPLRKALPLAAFCSTSWRRVARRSRKYCPP